ncbi:prolyl-tRNA editing enzyme YbaK/EbsC (Cys-tRNA(Pro) deacylase) [Paenibacillus sp. RC62]
MRILDGQNVNYKILSYDHQDVKIDGMNVAGKIGTQLELSPQDLAQLMDTQFTNLTQKA